MKALTLCWALAVIPYAKERMRDRDVKYNMTRPTRVKIHCIGGICCHCPFNGNDTCLTARISPHMPVQPKSLERGVHLMKILNHGEA